MKKTHNTVHSLFKVLAQISVNMKLIPTVTNFPHGYTRRVTLLDILGADNQVVYLTSLYLFKSFLPTKYLSIGMLSLLTELQRNSASKSSELKLLFSWS